MLRDPHVVMDEHPAFEEIRQATMTAFCAVLQKSRLPPLEVLRLSAMAVGAVYREIAEAHQGTGACPCGWEPWEAADLHLLRQAIAGPPEPAVASGLLTARAMGSA